MVLRYVNHILYSNAFHTKNQGTIYGNLSGKNNKIKDCDYKHIKFFKKIKKTPLHKDYFMS